MTKKLFNKLLNVYDKYKHSKLRKGDEILGFAIILPMILTVIIVCISTAQIGTFNEKLTTVAYNSCRAAVVCETSTKALKEAKTVYKHNLTPNTTEYVKLEILKDEEGNTYGNPLDAEEWVKGNYVRCTVYYKLDTLMPYTSGVRTASIVMMIENDKSQTIV
jgi:ABC-type Na+ efflux pump permease subunit